VLYVNNVEEAIAFPRIGAIVNVLLPVLAKTFPDAFNTMELLSFVALLYPMLTAFDPRPPASHPTATEYGP
jgi:hypothetical protein